MVVIGLKTDNSHSAAVHGLNIQWLVRMHLERERDRERERERICFGLMGGYHTQVTEGLWVI